MSGPDEVEAAHAFEHRLPMELPKPTGRFAVGRTTLYWVNTVRGDEFAPVPGTPRELVAWI
jgi:hypothetical protein